MLREATYPPAAVNVLDVSSESMTAFQVFTYGRFWVFTEATFGSSLGRDRGTGVQQRLHQLAPFVRQKPRSMSVMAMLCQKSD